MVTVSQAELNSVVINAMQHSRRPATGGNFPTMVQPLKPKQAESFATFY
jgi:hypothetical protein